MILGTLNPEKIRHENPTDLSTSPVRGNHFTFGNPKRVIFNSIIHTYFWLFTLSHKKTNCDPLAHPTWKCHHTNLWTAKLFHLTEGLLRSFKRWWLWRQPVVVIGDSEKNWLWCVATGMASNVTASVQSGHLLHGYVLPVFFGTYRSHAALKFSPCRNKPLPQLVCISTRAHPVACPRRSTRAMQIIGSTKHQ